jgi:hypothetical protein
VNPKRYLTLAALICTLALMMACQAPTTPPLSSAGPVTDYTSLVDNLRAGGATVEPVGETSQDFFSVEGRAIRVNGADVQVFEYDSDAAAQEEAELVSPTGSPIGTTMVTWVETPHFYGAGRLIVLYVGDDEAVTAALEDALGSQFAGS